EKVVEPRSVLISGLAAPDRSRRIHWSRDVSKIIRELGATVVSSPNQPPSIQSVDALPRPSVHHRSRLGPRPYPRQGRRLRYLLPLEHKARPALAISRSHLQTRHPQTSSLVMERSTRLWG